MTSLTDNIYNVVTHYPERGAGETPAAYLEAQGKGGHPLRDLALAVMEHPDNARLLHEVGRAPLTDQILKVYWDLTPVVERELDPGWGWSERHLGDNALRVMEAAHKVLNPLAYLQHVRTHSPELADFAWARLNDHIPGAGRDRDPEALGIDSPDWGAWWHELKQMQIAVKVTGREGAFNGAGAGTPFAEASFFAICPALKSRMGPLQLGCYMMGDGGGNMIVYGSWDENTLCPEKEHKTMIPDSIKEVLRGRKVSTLHMHRMRHKTPLRSQFALHEGRPEGLGSRDRFQLFTHHSVHEGALGDTTYDVKKFVPMGVFEPEGVEPLVSADNWHNPVAFHELRDQEVYIHPVDGHCVMSPNTAGLRLTAEIGHFWLVYMRDDGGGRVNAFVIENFVTRKD